MTVQTRFILNVAFCTILFNLATTAILRSQEPSQAFDRSFRSLSRDKRNPQPIAKKTTEELPKEQPKIVDIDFLDYHRKIARDNFQSCFSLKELQANRPVGTSAKTGKQETEQERLAAVDIDWKDLQKHCSYKYFKDPAKSVDHMKLQSYDDDDDKEKEKEKEKPKPKPKRRCYIMSLFLILRENGMFTDSCFRFAVAFKNYIFTLKKKQQEIHENDKVENSYKSYIFKAAVKRGENVKLVKKEEVPELIRKTVVAIHSENRENNEDSWFSTATGSGNLVDFNPQTNTFNNICGKGVKTQKLNFLLTASHCFEDTEAQKVDINLNLPKSLLETPFVLVTMETYFENKVDKSRINLLINQFLKGRNQKPALVGMIPTNQETDRVKKDIFDEFLPSSVKRGANKKEEKTDPNHNKKHRNLALKEAIDMFKPRTVRRNNNPNQNNQEDSSLNTELSMNKIDKKLIGTQFIINLFQDEDFILYKLEKAVEITCPENGQFIDFSHANDKNNPRDQILKAMKDEKSVLNLYGFPGGWGPHKMKIRPFKLNERFFKGDNPENIQQNDDKIDEGLTLRFIFNGSTTNGASGGPLFLEENEKLSSIGTILRGKIDTFSPLEVKFNVRKLK